MMFIHWNQESKLRRYRRGELSFDQHRQYENHIAGCDSCRARIKQDESLEQLTRAAGQRLQPSSERLNALEQQILALPPKPGKDAAALSNTTPEGKHFNPWNWRPGLISYGVMVLLLVLSGIFYYYSIPNFDPLKIAGVMGHDVHYRENLKEALPMDANVGNRLKPGSRVIVGNDSLVMITIGNVGRLYLNSASEMDVHLNSSDTFELTKGEVWVDLKKHGFPFRVKTPAGMVSVTGTEFNIKVQPDDSVLVSSIQHDVTVSNSKGTTVLTPGYQASMSREQAPQPPHPFDANKEPYWKKALTKNGALTEQEKEVLWQQTWQKAKQLNYDADYQIAIKYYLECLYLNPAKYEPYCELGIIYGSIGDYGQSTTYLNRSYQMEPHSERTFSGFVQTYTELGQWEEAEKYSRLQTIEDPKWHFDYLLMAQMRIYQNRIDEAEAYYKKSHEIGNAEQCTGCGPDYYAGLAEIARQRHDLKTAGIYMKQSMDIQKRQNVFPNLIAGRYFADMHQKDDAVIQYQKYLQKNPNGYFAAEARDYIRANQ